MRKIIVDSFPFLNEFLSLDIRLATLYDHVDYFVLVEAKKTFSGNDKPLYFEENKERYIKYLDKIVHVVVENFKDCDNDAWSREAFQHNAIWKGLQELNLNDNDIVMISNVDEIPDPNLFSRFDELDQHNSFLIRHRFMNGFLNVEHDGNWLSSPWPYFFLGTRVAQYSLYKEFPPYEIRMMKDGVILDSLFSFHFHLLDSPFYKLQSYSHYNDHDIRDKEEMEYRLKLKEDLYHPENVKFQKVPIDNTYPKFVLDNLELFRKEGKIFDENNLFDIEPKIDCFVYTKNNKDKFLKTLHSIRNCGYKNLGFHCADASDGAKVWQNIDKSDNGEICNLIMSFHPYSVFEGGTKLENYERIIKHLSVDDHRHHPNGEFVLFVKEGAEVTKEKIIQLLTDLYLHKWEIIDDGSEDLILCRRRIINKHGSLLEFLNTLKNEDKVVDENDFQELLESVQEGGKILQNIQEPFRFFNMSKTIEGYKIDYRNTEKYFQENFEWEAEKKTVSIIIPCYNGVDLTKQCIDSILSSETHNTLAIIKEIYVHSNGSTDSTSQMLQEYSNKDPRIKPIYSEHPLGYARAFNFAVQFCTSDFIVSCNNDITVWDNWLDRFIEPMLNNSGIGVSSFLLDNQDGDEYILGALYCVRKNVLQEVGLIDESFQIGFCEEYDFSKRILSAGYKLHSPTQILRNKENWSRDESIETDFPCNHIGGQTLYTWFSNVEKLREKSFIKEEFYKKEHDNNFVYVVDNSCDITSVRKKNRRFN